VTPNLQTFKAWSSRNARVGHTVALAMAYAQCKREQVDAYIKPIFDLFDFYPSEDMVAHGVPRERITDPERLYMTDLEGADYKRFLKECDKEHRAHGFPGPKGHCPALVAEDLQRKAEHALLLAGGELFGVDFTVTHGETRQKAIDLLLGATLKAWSEKRRAA
jgi:hypothetical protein